MRRIISRSSCNIDVLLASLSDFKNYHPNNHYNNYEQGERLPVHKEKRCAPEQLPDYKNYGEDA
jgi:hypothetical protein